jgi:gamma-glutamyltranspeptidase/glutathione hydrolase
MALAAPSAMGAAATTRGDRYAGEPWASRSPVIAQHGMAVTEEPLASLAAVEILKRGGNAVDAAIAASAMLSLTVPNLNGLGADAFVMVWDPKTHKLYGYNGSGPSPKGRSYAQMLAEVRAADRKAGVTAKPGAAPRMPSAGPLSVTLPGTVDTWYALHSKFGKLPMAEDLAAAIRYAKEGFPVTQVSAQFWRADFKMLENNPFLKGNLGGLEHTFMIDGHTPAEGEVFKNPDLARVLESIVAGGRDAFYKGKPAHVIVDYLNKLTGHQDWSYADFADYHGEWVTPRSVDYRGYDVYELPPNGQGFAVLEMLNVLSGYNLKAMGATNPDTLMAMIGAKRLAYADLAKYYADPRFYQVPANGLLSTEYANARRKLLNLQHANPDIDAGNPFKYNGDTTNFATADDSGMMVSMIESDANDFGSGLVPPGLGFALQNRGEGFTLDPHDAAVYAPGKRPFHTIIPAFVLKDGAPWFAFSVMGGSFQPVGQVEVLVNMIDFGMNLQEASDAARWDQAADPERADGKPATAGTVKFERGYPAELIDAIHSRGYATHVMATGFPHGFVGGFSGIRFDAKTHTYWGGVDHRKDGEAIGY